MNIPRILLLMLLAIAAHASAQELPDIRPRHANGLIYDESAMARLRAVVDSLHATFDPEGMGNGEAPTQRTSRPVPRVLSETLMRRSSRPEGMGKRAAPMQRSFGSFLQLVVPIADAADSGRLDTLLAELAAGALPESVAERYAMFVEVGKGGEPIEMMGCAITEERGTRGVPYTCFDIGGYWYHVRDTMLASHPPRPGAWVVDTMSAQPGAWVTVGALHIAAPFRMDTLPWEYERIVRYADHLGDGGRLWIDDETDTTDPFLDGLSRALRALFDLRVEAPEVITTIRYDPLHPEGVRDYALHPAYDSALRAKRAEHLPRIAELMRAEAAGAGRYGTLSLDSIAACRSRDRVVDYIERAVSVELAMELYRRHVAALDRTMPWEQRRNLYEQIDYDRARELVRLAVAAGRWDVYLPAQRSVIANAPRHDESAWDRSENVTDMRELEATGVSVVDLLLGMILGSYARHFSADAAAGFGRAFAESGDSAAFEHHALAMIADERLDPHRRTALFNVYVGYLRNLPDGRERIAAMVADAAAFPEFLRDEIGEMGVERGEE